MAGIKRSSDEADAVKSKKFKAIRGKHSLPLPQDAVNYSSQTSGAEVHASEKKSIEKDAGKYRPTIGKLKTDPRVKISHEQKAASIAKNPSLNGKSPCNMCTAGALTNNVQAPLRVRFMRDRKPLCRSGKL